MSNQNPSPIVRIGTGRKLHMRSGDSNTSTLCNQTGRTSRLIRVPLTIEEAHASPHACRLCFAPPAGTVTA